MAKKRYSQYEYWYKEFNIPGAHPATIKKVVNRLQYYGNNTSYVLDEYNKKQILITRVDVKGDEALYSTFCFRYNWRGRHDQILCVRWIVRGESNYHEIVEDNHIGLFSPSETFWAIVDKYRVLI